jgi:hypothetical protein
MLPVVVVEVTNILFGEPDALNVAVTIRVEVISTVHVLTPVQPSPDQPANLAEPAANAVSTTIVALGYDAVQTAQQSMPLGFDVTEPAPVPMRDTVSVATPSGP